MSQIRQPAEWEKHKNCWTAWPSAGDLWQENLAPAQAEFTALCKAIGASEHLQILVPKGEQYELAKKALQGVPVTFHHIAFGDIWLRDTGPIFIEKDGKAASTRFRFNGWGEKYVLEGDDMVSTKVAGTTPIPNLAHDFVLEGGAVDSDGEGTLLTTKQCLLNNNRQAGGALLTEALLEKRLATALGAKKLLWIEQGLLNDHTDGHVDNLARFVGPAHVVCMQALDKKDPNHDILESIYQQLSGFTDAKGRKLKITRVPSPGPIYNDEDKVMPASYMNFYISNQTVIVPTYGTSNDAAAVAAIASCFSNHSQSRKTIGLASNSILSGGGSFHCITQQEPA